MGTSLVTVGWPLVVALGAMVALAVSVAALTGVGTGRMTVVAAVRATAQLTAVAAVIVLAVRTVWGAGAFVLVMVAVATWTSGRRIASGPGGRYAGVAIVAGAAPVVAIVLGTGTVPPTGLAVVPVSGLVIGGAMTATSLAGRRALDELDDRRGEFEAAIALGLLDRDAVLLVVGHTAREALLPALDQTRTVGLVTLPGAFVGVLLGSGDPVQAGAAQIVVLVGLLAAETIAARVAVEMVARGRIRRADPARDHTPAVVWSRTRGVLHSVIDKAAR